MTRTSTLAAFAALCLSAAFAPAFGGGLQVPMDQVKIITFKKPIAAVYVGNPVIADVTMIDTTHVFLMGKTYGQTNMIALGPDGKTVADDQVVISGRTAGLVTLNRGSLTFNYACTTIHCETQPVPGDPKTYFDETHASQGEHEDMATKAAAVGAGAANGSGSGQ